MKKQKGIAGILILVAVAIFIVIASIKVLASKPDAARRFAFICSFLKDSTACQSPASVPENSASGQIKDDKDLMSVSKDLDNEDVDQSIDKDLNQIDTDTSTF